MKKVNSTKKFLQALNNVFVFAKGMDPTNFSYLLEGDLTFAYICTGLAYTFAFAIVGKVSGGHMNPALTIASAIWKKTTWKAVPFYLAGQAIGSLCGIALVYTLQIDAIREIDLKKALVAPRIMISNSYTSVYK